ncbi:MAG: hypothetical protein AABX35_04495 [Nanoarchaeota archaeon]
MKLTRRHTIAGLAALLTAGAFLIPTGEKTEPYTIFYNREIKENKRPFIHKDTRKPWDPSKEERAELESLVKSKYPTATNLVFEETITTTSFDIPEKTADDFYEHQFRIIQAGFKYLGAKESRTWGQRIIHPDLPINVPAQGKIPFYQAFFAGVEDKTLTFTLPESNQSVSIKKPTGIGSSFERHMTFDEKNNPIKASSSFNRGIIINNDKAIHSYQAAFGELLHVNLSEDTIRWIEAKIRKEMNVQNFNLERAYQITDEATLREEGIVHAGVQKFMEKTGEREGFTKREIADFWEAMTSLPTYRYGKRAYELLGKDVKADFTRLRNNYDLLDKK